MASDTAMTYIESNMNTEQMVQKAEKNADLDVNQWNKSTCLMAASYSCPAGSGNGS